MEIRLDMEFYLSGAGFGARLLSEVQSEYWGPMRLLIHHPIDSVAITRRASMLERCRVENALRSRVKAAGIFKSSSDVRRVRLQEAQKQTRVICRIVSEQLRKPKLEGFFVSQITPSHIYFKLEQQ